MTSFFPLRARSFSRFFNLFRSGRRAPQRADPPARSRLRLESLESRLAPATLINLTTGNQQDVNGAIYSTRPQDVLTVGAGTGLIDSFVRISTNANKEQGVNTDANQQVLDNLGKGGTNFVHSLKITDL